jgi:hypothetical protein
MAAYGRKDGPALPDVGAAALARPAGSGAYVWAGDGLRPLQRSVQIGSVLANRSDE